MITFRRICAQANQSSLGALVEAVTFTFEWASHHISCSGRIQMLSAARPCARKQSEEIQLLLFLQSFDAVLWFQVLTTDTTWKLTIIDSMVNRDIKAVRSFITSKNSIIMVKNQNLNAKCIFKEMAYLAMDPSDTPDAFPLTFSRIVIGWLVSRFNVTCINLMGPIGNLQSVHPWLNFASPELLFRATLEPLPPTYDACSSFD